MAKQPKSPTPSQPGSPIPEEKTESGTVLGEKASGTVLSHAIEAEIERTIGSLVQGGARDQVVAKMTALMVRESFSGPLPHPRHLAAYEQVSSGLAERIVAMAERGQQHTIDIDQAAINAEIDDRKRGMRYGLAVFLALIAAGLWVSLKTESVGLTAVFLGAAAIGGITIFINGRNGK